MTSSGNSRDRRAHRESGRYAVCSPARRRFAAPPVVNRSGWRWIRPTSRTRSRTICAWFSGSRTSPRPCRRPTLRPNRRCQERLHAGAFHPCRQYRASLGRGSRHSRRRSRQGRDRRPVARANCACRRKSSTSRARTREERAFVMRHSHDTGAHSGTGCFPISPLPSGPQCITRTCWVPAIRPMKKPLPSRARLAWWQSPTSFRRWRRSGPTPRGTWPRPR